MAVKKKVVETPSVAVSSALFVSSSDYSAIEFICSSLIVPIVPSKLMLYKNSNAIGENYYALHGAFVYSSL